MAGDRQCFPAQHLDAPSLERHRVGPLYILVTVQCAPKLERVEDRGHVEGRAGLVVGARLQALLEGLFALVLGPHAVGVLPAGSTAKAPAEVEKIVSCMSQKIRILLRSL